MNKIIEASKFILDQTNFNGQTGFILGSGLGGFTDILTKKRILKYSKIPNYPQTTVEGHKGELIIGKLDHKDILVANGRFHLYEGHSIKDILFPIRVFKECELKLKDYQSDKKRGVYFCSFYENTNDFLQDNIEKSSLKLRQDFVYYNNLISEWWKPKAEKRFNKLKSDNRLISELHFWDKLFGLTYEQAKEKYLGEVGR